MAKIIADAVKRITRELGASDEQIVSSRAHSLNSESPAGIRDHRKLLTHIVVGFVGYEAEAKIVEIVKNSSPARQPSCGESSVGYQRGNITFRETVLVFSENHRVAVLPEKHYHRPRQKVSRQNLLRRKIIIRRVAF